MGLNGSFGASAIEKSMEESDLIFALAGEQSRKVYAVRLFSEGVSPKLLLSVARFDVRQFAQLPLHVPVDLSALAAKLNPAERHFFVFVEGKQTSVETIQQTRLGTLREILALRIWLVQHPEIASLLVISSGFHLRRVRMCCRSLLPKNVRVAFAGTKGESKWWRNTRVRWHVLTELVKIPLYFVVLPFAKPKISIRQNSAT